MHCTHFFLQKSPDWGGDQVLLAVHPTHYPASSGILGPFGPWCDLDLGRISGRGRMEPGGDVPAVHRTDAPKSVAVVGAGVAGRVRFYLALSYFFSFIVLFVFVCFFTGFFAIYLSHPSPRFWMEQDNQPA